MAEFGKFGLHMRLVIGLIAWPIVVACPAVAETPAFLREGRIVDVVLSDGASRDIPRRVERVQQVFNPVTRRLERRRYEVFDFAPAQGLDFSWWPDNIAADRSGPVSGVGRLIWRDRSAPVYDPAGVVSAYEGAMRSGRPYGRGRLIMRDGLVYDGEWRDGRAQGDGMLQLPDGEEYSGLFAKGFAEGRGVFVDATGERFEGNFRSGLRDGAGRTILPTGFSYDSRWSAGKEEPGSLRIRMAQTGGVGALGGGDDLRLGVTVVQNPGLPKEVNVNAVFLYTMETSNESIKVKPSDPKIIGLWKGNRNIFVEADRTQVRAGILGYDQRYHNVMAPTFRLSFQNRSAHPFEVASLRLEISKSYSDLQPSVQIRSSDAFEGFCGSKGYDPTFKLENFGWSEARDARFQFRFQSARAPAPPLGAMVKNIGILNSTMVLDFSSELSAVGVQVNRLKRMAAAAERIGLEQGAEGQAFFPCSAENTQQCAPALRTNPIFGRLGPLLEVEDASVYVKATGTFEYNWRDAKGETHPRSSPFTIRVGLGMLPVQAECGEGAAPQPLRVNPVSLKLDQTGYTIPVSFRRTIQSGQTSQFTLPIDAEKSSEHDFRIVAVLSDGRTIASRPVSLLYYRARMPRTQ